MTESQTTGASLKARVMLNGQDIALYGQKVEGFVVH